jgi:hypothetical protein
MKEKDKKKKRFLGFVVGLFLAIFLLPLFTLAQTTDLPAGQAGDLRLSTSPLPINLKATPGSTVSAQLKVKNDGLGEEKIKTTLMKFKADSQTGAPMLLEREAGDSFFDWVKFSEDIFTLPSNEWKTVEATFTVPETASFGYYYAVVFSRADEKINLDERQTALTGGLATLVLLEVQVPGAKKEVSLEEFSVAKKMYEFLPATFNVKLKNTGNVHTAPRGNIFLSRGKTEVATIEVNSGMGSILPNSPRDFSQNWTDGFPVYTVKMEDGKTVLDEQGNQVLKLKWDFKDASKLRFGKYTAKLLMVYDDGQKDVPLEGEVSFWVVPWRLVGVFIFNFALILALVLYVIRLRRRLRQLRQEQNKLI